MYLAWARQSGRWRAVGEGGSLDAAFRGLMEWIRQRERPPIASAVLPVGVYPAAQAGRGGATVGPTPAASAQSG